MRFRILGPLRVGDGPADRAVTASRDRVVLAMLLTRPGRTVSLGDLVEAVWGDRPPATARGQLQSCVSRLRRALPAVGVPGDVLVTHPAGYAVHPGPGNLDAAVFTELTARARDCLATDPERAGSLFRSALDLWRGPALDDIDSPVVRQRATALDELRMTATEDWVDLEVGSGRQREVLGELFELVERYPLRERLRARLMLALARSGRQAEALAQFQLARRILRDELGIEPGDELAELHQRVLAGQVGARHGGAGAGTAAARCLPRPVVDFTGRADTVRRMVDAVESADGSAPVILLVDGMPGSGKSALAGHVAHLVAARFPDAHLFVDLHGHSERSPVEPAAALVTLLRQLGIPGDRIPTELDDRVALWRSELASRRALIMLDNAAGTAQVVPLLPGGSHCLVLVTSRRRLAGLDGVRPESLPVLPERDGVQLLRRIAGDRVAAEPVAAAEVVRRCGRLPLAIRLAGARLAHRPRWTVADLVERLGGAGAALPELAVEDRTVASAFALSYAQLSPPAQRLFRWLGRHPGGDFDAPSVAALVGRPLPEARDTLDDLVDWHLVEEPRPGRYRLHDLVREYAAGLADTDPPGDRAQGVARLLDHHVHTTARVTRPLEADSARFSRQPGEPLRPDLIPPGPVGEDWLELERPNLVGLIDAALGVGRHDAAWRLARAAWRFLFLRGYFDDLVETHRRGLVAAVAGRDLPGEATMRNYLASAYYRTGRYEEAAAELTRSAELREASADEHSLALTLGNLGAVYELVGPLERSLALTRRALQTWRRLGELHAVAHRLSLMGTTLTLLGRHAEAMRCLRTTLQVSAESGYTFGVSNALGSLAALRIRLGEVAMAERLLGAALALRRRSGFRIGEGEALTALGTVRQLQGRYREAVELHLAALAIMRELGERNGEAMVCNDLASTRSAMGDPETALGLHRDALALAARSRLPYQQARALEGIADLLGDSDPAAARQHRGRALVLYRDLGVPEHPEVRRCPDAPD